MTGRENKVGLVGFGKKFFTLATKPKLPRKVAYFSQLSMIISEYTKPFRSYLLNSTANPANFHPNWVGLAVLFSSFIFFGLDGVNWHKDLDSY